MTPTREARLQEKAKRQEAAGIPDSPVLTSGHYAENQEHPLADYHVMGFLVRDLAPEIQARVTIERTDEYMAATPGVEMASVGATPEDKAIRQRRDERQDSYRRPVARDPLGELMRKHVTDPGMKGRFIRPDNGKGIWNPVIADGKEVKYREMVLAQAPVDVVSDIKAHTQEKTRRQTAALVSQHKKREGVGSIEEK
jgi:hypothetical protein